MLPIQCITLAFCITYFDEAELLPELLAQICSEENGPDEILIYDDASKRPPVRLPHDPRIKIFRSEINRGPSAGRNELLAACTSEYIHFHDADDLIVPGWARETREAIVQGSAPDVVFHTVEHRTSAGPAGWCDKIATIRDDKALIEHAIRDGLLVPSATMRTKLVRELGGFPGYVQSEDYAFYIKLALARPRFVALSRPSVLVRLRPDSRSADKHQVYRDTLSILTEYHGRLPKQHRGVAAEKALSMARNLFAIGDLGTAREGFRLAHRISWRCFGGQRIAYAVASLLIGSMNAERLSRLTRTLRHGL